MENIGFLQSVSIAAWTATFFTGLILVVNFRTKKQLEERFRVGRFFSQMYSDFVTIRRHLIYLRNTFMSDNREVHLSILKNNCHYVKGSSRIVIDNAYDTICNIVVDHQGMIPIELVHKIESGRLKDRLDKVFQAFYCITNCNENSRKTCMKYDRKADPDRCLKLYAGEIDSIIREMEEMVYPLKRDLMSVKG